MRVLIISKTLDSEGGVANFVRILIKYLDSVYHPIHFPIGTRKRGYSRYRDGMLIIYKYIKLYIEINKLRPDVVHLNPSLNFKSLIRDWIFFMIIKLAYRKQPLLVFFHGWDIKTEKIIEKFSIVKSIFIFFLKKVNIIVVLSDTFKKKLMLWGVSSDRIIRIPTMFDGDLYAGANKNHLFTGKQILFLSRLEKAKGVYELLEGFRLTLAEYPRLRLIIAGDGMERNNIIDWIHKKDLTKNISIPGYLRGSEKKSVLIGSDIFILPSSHPEGLPISIIEAMAAGLVIITTAVGGIPEHVKDGYNGIILSMPVPGEISRALVRCLNDPEFCQQIQANNIRQAWERYEAIKVTNNIQTLYQKALAYAS